MGRSIDDYRKKRDFERTPEPEPQPARTEPDRAPVYVVHRHDATRLHYDLRLEMEGVLRSWAVPKGFSYAPEDKHLAIQTEDHPMEYEHFEGVIPKGQYGAGTMTIWDRGHYEVVKADSGPRAIASGELKIVLRGRKLRGEWHLVKTKQAENTWLLFKSKDRYAGSPRDSALGVDIAEAREAPLPRAVRKMEIGARSEPFSDPAWLFEMKFSGQRVLAVKDGERITLRGIKRRLPAIEKELQTLRAERAILDGVLVATDEQERPSRERLEAALSGASADPVYLYVFDLLYFEEYDLRPLSLVDRKGALRNVLPKSPHVLHVDHVPGNGEQLVVAVSAAGLPAVVAKRADSPYVAGPSDAWCEVPVDAATDSDGLAVSEALTRKRPRRSDARVKYSNLDKVFWPAEGFTKGDLIAFYERVADVLLPYLHERPLHMNRYPDGIEGKSFYQKDAREFLPDWVETEPIPSEHRGEPINYLICNDRETLLFLANLGSIDLHPWMSRRGSLLSPDYAVIDLDPKEAPFTDVVEIAQHVGEILRGIGLHPLLKTSGATGLHIHIGLAPGYTYDQARMFCEGVARVVARDLSSIATVERVVGRREGKVYVDFGQNRRGQTIVPPYVPRPVRGATVSTPLSWEELDADLRPSQFTIQTVPGRLEEQGDLYAPLLTEPEDLMSAIEALQGMIR